MNRIEIDAVVDNLPKVIDYIDENLDHYDCSMKARTQIDIAVEELFVNIANYAYPEGSGKATITFDYDEEEGAVIISFIDSGIPYDPLSREDPDVSLPAEERQIGGLGIFMVKKSMDDVRYEYVNNMNKTSIIKKIG
ncbi:ATP-binding protein [Butyrivibrio sp. MC2013]|uniref:ATP-binding protein n=1 Tax=Butyrivibrio sp. MC2013 TaxID=1280686 RepID=UPI00040C5DA4|nr:ATP-binding protein [Butyrivibrio sp. MC2013]